MHWLSCVMNVQKQQWKYGHSIWRDTLVMDKWLQVWCICEELGWQRHPSWCRGPSYSGMLPPILIHCSKDDQFQIKEMSVENENLSCIIGDLLLELPRHMTHRLPIPRERLSKWVEMIWHLSPLNISLANSFGDNIRGFKYFNSGRQCPNRFRPTLYVCTPKLMCAWCEQVYYPDSCTRRDAINDKILLALRR